MSFIVWPPRVFWFFYFDGIYEADDDCNPPDDDGEETLSSRNASRGTHLMLPTREPTGREFSRRGDSQTTVQLPCFRVVAASNTQQ